jgi:hypothetical protein
LGRLLELAVIFIDSEESLTPVRVAVLKHEINESVNCFPPGGSPCHCSTQQTADS